MMSVIVGAAFILVGLLWILACLHAGGMASRQVNLLHEIILPASFGVMGVGVGITLLIGR